MSVCYRLVLDRVCRSNHHRLAVLALEHLRGPDAGAWRDVFLKNRGPYLEGAKAPDTVFRDFRNHVLHVRDGDWGGAPQAAREWYRRTVRALQQKDWRYAAYCAGVMSHYVVDPLHPFHTHQSEEENVIHRALEWSLSQAFGELFLILTQDLGFPDIPVPDGDDWLEAMVKAGALEANRHYEMLIDHYDFAAGVRRPVEGLDQEIKDCIAGLMGHAAIMLSRIIDRAIAEAKARAPAVSLLPDAIGIIAATPVRAVLRRIEAVAEMDVIAEQYGEFRRTGKVRETLGDDDRAVRMAFAEEVLKVPISSLDCQWPRETGLRHAAGAPARPSVRRPALLPRMRPSQGRPLAAPVQSPHAPLSREAPVVDAPSIGPRTAGRLDVLGIRTVGDLLSLAPEDAARRIKATHINARVIRDWQAQALLACQVPGLSGLSAQILVGAGIASLEDLARADAEGLMQDISRYLSSAAGARILRDNDPPERVAVEAWIRAAGALCADLSAA